MKPLHNFTRPRRLWLLIVCVTAFILSVAGIASAAEFGSGERYQLPAGQIVEDDLYVSAGTVIIDGIVQGDLIAFGGYIEVNGEVTGDLIAAGGGIVVNGRVGDDVRVSGAGITINGSIGDDLMAAGGGAAPGGFVYPVTVDGRNIQQGVYLNAGATVGGDAYVVGGTGTIAGTVDGDLFAAMNQITLTGTVAGDAALHGNTISVADSASVAGNLTYETSGQATVPAGVASQVTPIVRPVAEAQEEPLANRMIWWTIHLARSLIGLLALAAVALVLFPGFMNGTAGALRAAPITALAYGVLVVLVFVPLTMVLVLLAWLFWGVFPGGMAVTFFMIGFWGIVWLFSPIITGFWLGQTLLPNTTGSMVQAFVGATVILIVARAAEWVPLVGGLIGWLILLASFAFGVGAMIVYYRQRRAGAPA
jgi:cytoskeletal protein CcmA (bactofilin family)